MDCEACKDRRKQTISGTVDRWTHQADMARMERANNRLWITNIVLIFVIFAGIIGYLVWRNQWELSETTTIETEQQSDFGNNYAVGGDFRWRGKELK